MAQCTGPPGGMRRIALRAVLAVAQALAISPLLLLGFWVLVSGTRHWRLDRYWRSFPPSFGCDDRGLVDGCTAELLAYFWLAPAVASLAAIWAVFLRTNTPLLHQPQQPQQQPQQQQHHQQQPPPQQQQQRATAAAAAAAAAATLLPPRAFWDWWCGGLTAADAAAAAGWLGVNAMWAALVMRRYLSLLPFFERSHLPAWVLEAELAATACGALLYPNLVLLFAPVARGSIVLQALGVSYPNGIKYHRWVGHWTMALVAAHSLGFWGVWMLRRTWLEEALAQGSRVNNLAGGLSFLSGLALWLSSLEAPRRSAYSAFYVLHLVGFAGFFLFGVMHYSGQLVYCLPGLLLYAVDGAHRLHQGLGLADDAPRVEAAATDGGKEPAVVSLRLSCPSYRLARTGFLWLNVPAISSHQWHPFEYVAVANPAGGPSTAAAAAALLHIKCYSRWTKALGRWVRAEEEAVAAAAAAGGSGAGAAGAAAAAAEVGRRLRVKVEGPFGEVAEPHVPHHPSHGLVFVAGGIGIAAALSVLAELPDATEPTSSGGSSGAADAGDGVAAAEAPPAKPAARQQLLVIWSCRHVGELLLLSHPLLCLAGRKGLEVTWRLHYTGAAKDLSQGAPSAPSAPRGTPAVPPLGAAAAAAPPAVCPAAPGDTSSMCPVLALRRPVCGAFHKSAVHAAVFAACLGVLLLVRGRCLVWAGDAPCPVAWTGAAYVVGLTVCGVGAGLAVLLLGRLGLWAQRRRGGGGPPRRDGSAREPLLPRAGGGAEDDKGSGGDGAGAGAAAPVVVRASLGGQSDAPRLSVPGFEPLAVAQGRPDLRAELLQWLARVGGGAADEERGGAAAAAAGQGAAGPVAAATVYGMGPGPLLSAAALLVDDLNRGRGEGAAAGRPRVLLAYEQRTHEL